jgi:hypothetical protein
MQKKWGLVGNYTCKADQRQLKILYSFVRQRFLPAIGVKIM